MNRKYLVFSTGAYEYLRDELLAFGSLEAGALFRESFPDGERYLRVDSAVTGRDVLVIGGTISDSDTLELFDLATSLVQLNARSLTLVIPYFGYSTMEHASEPGEAVTAKSRARILSAIPAAHAGNKALLFDLHSEGIAYYFEGPTIARHLRCTPLTIDAIKRVGGTQFVLGCTDAGRAKWTQSLANALGVDAAFVLKRREGSATRVIALSAQVEKKHVVIYDDMIRSGGSLIAAAEAFRKEGAAKLSVVVTHGVFPEGSVARLQSSGLFDCIACTDTHPRARMLGNGFVRVQPIAHFLHQLLTAEHSAIP